MSISGFIQAGGQSRRMGQPKALLPFGSRRLIEYPLAALAPIVSQLGVITNNPELYRDFNLEFKLELYPDRWPGQGPLAGIGAALTNSRNDYNLIVACDMPFVTTPLLQLLVAEGQGYQVCVPRSIEGELQPLCALYHRDCLPVIEAMLTESVLAPRQLFQRVPTRIVPFEQFVNWHRADSLFLNVNTPEDLAHAIDLMKG